MNNSSMDPVLNTSAEKVSPVALALDCQALRHYSDFDTTSESGCSDLSYVRPNVPKFVEKRGKLGSESIRSGRKCGARAARRRENDAFLNSLSMIVEVNQEEMENMVWPDSISSCSAFTRLFKDDGIRAVWDAFVTLSEADQAKLLSSLRRPDGYTSETSDSPASAGTSASGTADGVCLSDEDDSDWRPALPRLASSHPKRRSPKRGHRRSKQRREDSVLTSSAAGDHTSDSLLYGRLAAPRAVSSKEEMSVPGQPALRNLLPPRFYSVLNRSLNCQDKRHSRRCRRNLTTLDLCLIGRVELELRHLFSGSSHLALGHWEDRVRWTPTASLLSDSPGSGNTEEGEDTPPLRLSAFERLLVHCIASYLGLVSYSEGAASSSDRQLWVEAKLNRGFQPPEFTFLQLLRTQFSRSPIRSVS